jgi:SAM-dependent methyltransferase
MANSRADGKRRGPSRPPGWPKRQLARVPIMDNVGMKQATFLVAGLIALLGCAAVPQRAVRFEPTPMPVVRAMLELAGVGPTDVVYDLGSGDGRIPIAAARDFGARGVGIEIDPALVAQSRANAREAGVADRVTFHVGDMFEADVRPATVVTLFLHPKPNLQLRPTLEAQLQPGARIVSYMWDMGDWTPDETKDVGRDRIFLWRIGTAAEGRAQR